MGEIVDTLTARYKLDDQSRLHPPAYRRLSGARGIVWLSLIVTAAIACGGGSTISPPGGPCGGNVRNPPVCATGYYCASATDGGPPVGDVGGICRKVGT